VFQLLKNSGSVWQVTECARVVYWTVARQHKSQFEQLIEAARKNRAGLKKPGEQSTVDVQVEQTRLDDGTSSTSSVELIADTEMLTSDGSCVTTDDVQPAINQPVDGNLPLTLYAIPLDFCVRYSHCVFNAMRGQTINLPVCVCVRHTFCRLAYRWDRSMDFYSW